MCVLNMDGLAAEGLRMRLSVEDDPEQWARLKRALTILLLREQKRIAAAEAAGLLLANDPAS